MGKLSNGWTDWHQFWYTSADSSGNVHRLNTIRPSIPRGYFGGGGYGVTTSKVLGSCQTAGPIGTKFGTHLQIHLGMDICQTNGQPIHKGALGGFYGSTFKNLEKLSNGWTDWHQLWFTSADSSGNGHRLNPSRSSISQGELGGGVGVTYSKVLGSCQTAAPIGTEFGTRRRICLGMDIG